MNFTIYKKCVDMWKRQREKNTRYKTIECGTYRKNEGKRLTQRKINKNEKNISTKLVNAGNNWLRKEIRNFCSRSVSGDICFWISLQTESESYFHFFLHFIGQNCRSDRFKQRVVLQKLRILPETQSPRKNQSRL